MADRMLMPARIMTESWLVKLWTSLSPGPRLMEKLTFPLRPTDSTGVRERMYSPRARSWADAALRSVAWTCPAVTFPPAPLAS